MTRLITKAALLSACGMLVASAAMAGIPAVFPASVAPSYIRLVNNALGVPDSTNGKFSILVRDVSLNPVIGSNVLVDFSGCADLQIASDQMNVNSTVNCTGRTVQRFTNASGVVDFTIQGNSRLAAISGAGCARIYADGLLISSPTVAAFDLDGASGVTPNDQSVFLTDLGIHIYYGRDDFDANGLVNPNDLSVFLTMLGTHLSATSPVTKCPL